MRKEIKNRYFHLPGVETDVAMQMEIRYTKMHFLLCSFLGKKLDCTNLLKKILCIINFSSSFFVLL